MVDTGHVEKRILCYLRKDVFIMTKQKRYSKEFKRQAAELVVRQGYTKAEARARERPARLRRFVFLARASG